MALNDDDPLGALLARTGQALRELAEPGWDRIADSVIANVRAIGRSGWPLAAADPDPSDPPIPGRIHVSDLVLRGALARALRLDNICAPTAIEVFTDADELQRVCIEITGRYGNRLEAVADQVRARTGEIIDDLLGAGTPNRIDVIITDVVAGNPLSE